MIELLSIYNTTPRYFRVTVPPFAEDEKERDIVVCVKAASDAEAEIFLTKFYRYTFIRSKIKPVLITEAEYLAAKAAKSPDKNRFAVSKAVLKKRSRGGSTKRGHYEKKLIATGRMSDNDQKDKAKG